MFKSNKSVNPLDHGETLNIPVQKSVLPVSKIVGRYWITNSNIGIITSTG